MIAAQSLETFFENTYWPRKKIRCGPNTRRLHGVAIRNFAKWLTRTPLLTDFTDDNLTAFIGARLDEVSPFTANRDAEKLLTLWRFAARKKFVEDFPDVEFAVEPKRTPLAWTETEVRTLFDALALLPGFIGSIPKRQWWLGLHGVIWDSAERIGAVRECEWSDLDLKTGWLIVKAEYRKGRREDKPVKLHADTLACLDNFPHHFGKLFPWPQSDSNIYRVYKAILKCAGLPHDRRSKFHRVRRTVASFFEAGGGSAQKLLGHASAKTTEAYLDPRICGGIQPCHVIFRPGG